MYHGFYDFTIAYNVHNFSYTRFVYSFRKFMLGLKVNIRSKIIRQAYFINQNFDNKLYPYLIFLILSFVYYHFNMLRKLVNLLL